MSLKVRSILIDKRTNTPVVQAQIPIKDYMGLVGSDFDDFVIQRKRQKHKAYGRMKTDIKGGTLLPTITLAAKLDRAESLAELAHKGNNKELEKRLSQPGQVHILDGLQRTYIIQDIINDNHEFQKDQMLTLEFWLEKEIKHLIYRLIVLNAGQKPMSMRHQIELLFVALKERLESDLNLEIFTEKDSSRRTTPRKYSLDRVASCYHCFLLKNPELTKDNIVANALIEDDILDSSEEELGCTYQDFKNAFALYAKLDSVADKKYPGRTGKDIPSGVSWFGSENVMRAFFSAVAKFSSSTSRKKRVNNALARLVSDLDDSSPNDDILSLRELRKIENGFPTRKVNVGFATRKLISSGFREFFREEGEVALRDCWIAESE